jgi:hypothetical protein
MLIPGGKGAGNGWGFDCEFYPHRQAFENDFFPGCGRVVMQFQYEAQNRENRKSRNYYCLFLHPLLSFLAIWNLNTVPTVPSLDSGAKIYDAQTLFVALLLPRSIPWVRLF